MNRSPRTCDNLYRASVYASQTRGMPVVPTRNQKIIRQWALDHDAVPAEITPLKFDSAPAILTFLMGKAKGGTPEIHVISWDSFFAQFDLLGLAFAFDVNSHQFNLVQIEKPSDPFPDPLSYD